MKSLAVASLLFVLLVCHSAAAHAANPDFGPNVFIFSPSDANIQNTVDGIFSKQERSEFGPNRYCLLFRPGRYSLNARVGFYTQVAGLGQSPEDVSIVGSVQVNGRGRRENATTNFWRAVENFSVTPTVDNNTMIWAVSQGVAFRHIHVRGNVTLSDGGWSSGGFMADCTIDGTVDCGTQQQWLSRNVEWNQWKGGSWNMVFLGVNRPPVGKWPDQPYTVIERTPVVREKPYLAISDGGEFVVMAPRLRSDSVGTGWTNPPKVLPISAFYIAHDRDSAATMNAALDRGMNLILTPGIYHLEASLRVTRPGTIVLGLGYPTLIPDRGTPAMTVADVDGVSVAGILFEAGVMDSPTLLRVGEVGSRVSHANDPTFLYDIFARAGGPNVGQANCFVTINSANVVGDNFWLWRADHGDGAGWDQNKNQNGLIVNGQDVTIYGLAVEHCQGYQTVWNANGGRVYFYQSEMPYDPPSQTDWSHGGVRGYASYKVADGVTTHEAWGMGVYCVFYDAPVVSETAIETPTVAGVRMHHMVTLWLNGQPDSGIKHILNELGDSVVGDKFGKARLE